MTAKQRKGNSRNIIREQKQVWLRVVAALGFVFLCQSVFAQQARETFGKNRIQYKQFEWQYLTSENFDVYYYDNRRRVATEAIQYLEGEFDRITDLIGYPPYLKTKVFLYNSVTDLQQSNVGLNHTEFNVGGETEFIKPYVEIAHPGTVDQFKEQLIYKMTELMVNEMMFGGSLKDMFQNAVLLNLPEWFIRGASSYVSKGWNAEMDDYIRQLVRTKKINKSLKLTGVEAELVGQSMWNYIVEKYGKSSISNILNYTRVIRNEQKSVLITLGISFKQLVNDWKAYYSQMEEKASQSYIAPQDSSRVSGRHKKSVIFTTVKLSPDGNNIAYAENDRGRFVVKIKSLKNGKEITILTSGNKVFRQDVDHNVPLISWADENTLGVIGVKQGEYVFWLYDLTTRSKLPRELDRFSNIRSFDFSGNGRLAILSADYEGQNDLFLISSRRDRTRRLTNDLYDDFDPSFIPNSNTVVFSSNRTTDTTNTIIKGIKDIPNNYNLYAFDLDTTTNVVHRLTNTLSKDYYPLALDNQNIFYLSDQRGIVNIFKYDRSTGIYSQVTNYNSSIKEYDLNFDTRSLALVMDKNLKEDIFLVDPFNLDRQVFTPPTRRKEVQQAKAITERRKQEAPQKGISIKELINSRLRERADTIPKEEPEPIKVDTLQPRMTADSVDTDNYVFEDEVVKAPEPQPDSLSAKSDEIEVEIKVDETVNTEDYVFEDEAARVSQPSETFLNRYMKARETTRIKGPFPYEPKFTYENLITNFVVDPLRGFSVRLETQMNDMLENYRFFGGIQTAFDWKSGDIYGEIQYLPHRVDYSARIDRKVIFWDGYYNDQKYSWQKVEVGASLPLTVRTRLTLKPFFGYTRYVDRGNRVAPGTQEFRASEQQYYAGSRMELVYDNSLTTGLNTIEGTRGKISLLHYEGLGDKTASFSQVSLDFRHYQKIYKEIVFAMRGFAGSFFGNSRKYYVLGGMDNWFGNSINQSGTNNPLAVVKPPDPPPGQQPVPEKFNDNLIFTEFATSLRGFNYSTQYGSSVAIANAELRVPLIRALSGGPITSNFFRNMQLTAFYDIGTSWTGKPPINSNTSTQTRVVEGKPFKAEIRDFLNPWLYSYGFGFRSMMLGYYMKLDLAWPVENYQVKDPRIFVTLGFDF
ncbi:MAG: PD40 domain-containing protein [Cyclobacteriaceae bacterium]|nr:PD40 domain-containing protein [Cyclobacteriaceae bacterium]